MRRRSPARRPAKVRRLFPALCLLLSLLLLFQLVTAAYLFKKAIVRRNSPAESGVSEAGQTFFEEAPFLRLSVAAEDGTPLTGYLLYADAPSTRAVILFHGHGRDASAMADYAKFYHEENFHVFLSDARGHGESGGHYTGMGYLDRSDHLLFLSLLKEQLSAGTEFLLHGVSMGGAAALMLSGEPELPQKVRCVISDCAFSALPGELSYQLKGTLHLPAFPVLPLSSLLCRALAGYFYGEADPLSAVKKADLPIFFIHGALDDYTPPEMALSLYATAPPGSALWVVPGAEHAQSLYIDPDEYFARLSAFYEQHLH